MNQEWEVMLVGMKIRGSKRSCIFEDKTIVTPSALEERQRDTLCLEERKSFRHNGVEKSRVTTTTIAVWSFVNKS